MYVALKTLHVSTVALSIGLFLVRLLWAHTAPEKLRVRWVRVLPHLVDTILFASAVGLSVVVHQYPFVHGWLTAKVFALIAYVIAGSLALQHARSPIARNTAAVAALICISYIVAVALRHDPWPFT